MGDSAFHSIERILANSPREGGILGSAGAVETLLIQERKEKKSDLVRR